MEITEPSCTKAQKLYRGLQVGCHLQNRMQLIRQCSKSTLFANTVNSEICGRITMLVYYIVDLACILQVTTNLQSSVHFLEQTLAKGQKYAPPRRRINHGFCSLEQKLYGGRYGHFFLIGQTVTAMVPGNSHSLKGGCHHDFENSVISVYTLPNESPLQELSNGMLYSVHRPPPPPPPPPPQIWLELVRADNR